MTYNKHRHTTTCDQAYHTRVSQQTLLSLFYYYHLRLLCPFSSFPSVVTLSLLAWLFLRLSYYTLRLAPCSLYLIVCTLLQPAYSTACLLVCPRTCPWPCLPVLSSPTPYTLPFPFPPHLLSFCWPLTLSRSLFLSQGKKEQSKQARPGAQVFFFDWRYRESVGGEKEREQGKGREI